MDKCVICETIGIDTNASTFIKVNDDKIPVCAECKNSFSDAPESFITKQFLMNEDYTD